MNDENAPPAEPQSDASATLPAIEFASPGRFSVLNPASTTGAPSPLLAAPFRLGHDTHLQAFSTPTDARSHALALLQQAQRSLCLYTPDLEPWIYHHSAIQEACKQFLLANPKNRLRILLRDSSRAVKEGHRLLSLARKLSSNCQIRKLHPDYPNEEVSFLLVDNCGLLVRPDLNLQAGYALYQDPGRARLHQAQFEQAWNTSVSDADLRSFLL